MKPIIYCGNSAKDIKAFDKKARLRILRLLDMLRAGMDLHPKDFKHINTIGAGVYELRVKTNKQHRVFYITKFEEAIYVLHAIAIFL